MSSTYLDDVRAKRDECRDRMRALVANAESRPAHERGLTASERRALERDDAAFDRYDAELRRLEATASAIGPDAHRLQEAIASDNHRSRLVTPDQAPIRELMARALEGAHVAVDSYVNPVLYEARALQSAGGTAIPTTFADFVTVYQRTLTPMLDPNVVTVLGRADGAPLTLPRLTADVNHGGTVTAEAAGINELDPTISAVTLGAYKYAATTLWSAELAQDNAVGLEQLIARSTTRELSLDIGTHLTTGDDSGKPNGFITAASSGGTAAGTASWGSSATFFGWGDLITLFGSVAAPYRKVGSWMVSPDAYTKILQFRDGQNAPILIPGLGGDPATLLGRPVYENPAMAAVASASKSVAFGDFSQYIVTRVQPTRIEVSRDYKFGTDQVAIKVVERVDGDLVDTAAIRYLTSANT